ncbi:MAG: NYN domain-containing protein [Candidatus Vogelbacteria bacterium]|nr:NYN domain-containing protein [Candidatus Vogelbacteria bacterium]
MNNFRDNVAYIDGANLHNAVKQLGWKFDYRRFKIWLSEKYGAKQAYLFLGLIPKYKDLYTKLQEYGFTLVFKEVIYDNTGKPKGNCDADIVVLAMQNAYKNKFNKAILVSSDGDYASLVKFLKERNKISIVLSPYETKKCSVLLKRTGVKISYVTDQQSVLEEQKEKAPNKDGTSSGSLS